jgi:DNA polymerase I/DNA polymerase-2
MKTDFIPVDYDSFDFEGKNYARIIGRDSKGRRIALIDSCDIYFWAILKEGLKKDKIDKLIKKIKTIEINTAGRTTKIEKIELHDKNFLGKPVKALKIFATNYKDLHQIADQLGVKEIEKRRGYDLGFTTHYIIESKLIPLTWFEIQGEMLNNSDEFGGIDKTLNVDFCIKAEKIKKTDDKKFTPKILAYDIETDEIKIGEGEIVMISLVGENFKKVISCKKPALAKKIDFVEYAKDESELIKKFKQYIKEQSPDFLVGYFSDGFDLPYIKARAQHHKIKLDIGLDSSQPRFSKGINITGRISGIVHIDLLKFIKTSYSQYMQSETLSLNEVAKEFLNDRKKEFDRNKHSSKINGDEWEKYFEYNLHDSQLVSDLFNKFWPDMVEFSRIIQEPVFEVSRNGLSRQVEGYILHNLEKFDEIPEKRPTHEEIGDRMHRQPVEGAFVLEPKPGLYEDLVMFDFTSMHTSIIISMNISKGTLLEKKEPGANETPEILIDGEKQKFYFSKKPGFLPLLLKEIFEKRRQFKSEYKKNPNPFTLAKSNAFKVLSASVHGYIGFFGARYYSLESSASILAFVRKFNKDTIEKARKAGYNVIYGDTDSIAFTRQGHSKEEIKKFLDKLNSELPGVMELEVDGFFKRGIWVTTRAGITGAKKKYALLGEDEKLKIRGFETVRRDWCKLARDVQNKILKQILEDGNEKKALEYLKEVIKKIKKREIQKEDLLIKTQLKKSLSEYKAISPHVIAARKMKEQEIPVSQGNLISYFIAETKPGTKSKLVREKVKLPHEEGEYNVQYYLERQIIPAVENILQVFGINAKELIEGKKQMTLEDF